ncbi:MAG: urease accessory protein [Mycobacterium sp.]|nr:MAG: urease accessory protein [Mycobacterium sp.]
MESRLLVVAARDRLAHLEWHGGIQARCTGRDTVHLISTAAIPLGGDTIDIRVIVEDGARLRLRSAAAAVALPGPGTDTSNSCWDIDVAGDLDVDLQPTVVAATARHLSAMTVRLHGDGRVRFRERVQVGRHGESQGFWSGSTHADRHALPMLRHRVELGAGSLADDELSAPRAMISELCYPATQSVAEAGATVLTLAGGGTLTTWQADRLTG